MQNDRQGSVKVLLLTAPSSINMAWEFVRNAEPWVPTQT